MVVSAWGVGAARTEAARRGSRDAKGHIVRNLVGLTEYEEEDLRVAVDITFSLKYLLRYLLSSCPCNSEIEPAELCKIFAHIGARDSSADAF